MSKLLIDLDEIVTILIPMLCKLFSMELMEELLGKIMYLWGSFVILEDVSMDVCDCFLLWILRALYIYILYKK